MKKSGLLVLLLISAVLAGWYFYNPDRDIIDEEFTESESYRTLQQQLERERSKFGSSEPILDNVIYALLEDTQTVDIPTQFSLDSLSVDTLTSESYRIPITQLIDNSEYPNGTTFYRLGRFQKDYLTILLFLVVYPGVYPSVDVIMTTVENGSIRDTEWLAGYQKNISAEVTGKIEIYRNDSITVTQQRTRKYPVKQRNLVTYRYQILSDGTIQTEVNANR